MSQGSWGGGGGGGQGGGGGWGGAPPGGGGYGPPGGAPPGGGGYGGPPGGGGYGGPPGGAPPGGGGYGGPPGGAPPGGGGYGGPPGGAPPGGAPPGGGGYGGPPGGGPPGYGGYGPPPDQQQQQQQQGFAPSPAGYPPGYTPPTGGAVAWEDSSMGLFSRWWETVKGVIGGPRAFFEAASTNENIPPPLGFAVMTSSAGGLFYGVYQFLMYLVLGSFLAAFAKSAGGSGAPAGQMIAMMTGLGAAYIVIMPIYFAMLALIAPFITSGVLHLSLSILGGATKPYANTYRMVGYSHATYAFMGIPLFGGLIAGVYTIVLHVIGLDATHKCGTGKAVGAVLLPLALVCVCCCIVPMVFGVFSGLAKHGGHF